MVELVFNVLVNVDIGFLSVGVTEVKSDAFWRGGNDAILIVGFFIDCVLVSTISYSFKSDVIDTGLVEDTDKVFIWSVRGKIVFCGNRDWLIIDEDLSIWIGDIPGGGVIGVVRFETVGNLSWISEFTIEHK